ncbi:hypothetical protein COLO4_02639 [Corchorus olitorius]|uniref:Uncharacterized protein n=1 Tax=Corchorus olitorius TaxID=93759 RepID=A0A1R3L0M9_9ROSI|nr:hypothetical protein COLO4_02639 [Corchorus olitorius]
MGGHDMGGNDAGGRFVAVPRTGDACVLAELMRNAPLRGDTREACEDALMRGVGEVLRSGKIEIPLIVATGSETNIVFYDGIVHAVALSEGFVSFSQAPEDRERYGRWGCFCDPSIRPAIRQEMNPRIYDYRRPSMMAAGIGALNVRQSPAALSSDAQETASGSCLRAGVGAGSMRRSIRLRVSFMLMPQSSDGTFAACAPCCGSCVAAGTFGLDTIRVAPIRSVTILCSKSWSRVAMTCDGVSGVSGRMA